jgi:hypothetical protein
LRAYHFTCPNVIYCIQTRRAEAAKSSDKDKDTKGPAKDAKDAKDKGKDKGGDDHDNEDSIEVILEITKYLKDTASMSSAAARKSAEAAVARDITSVAHLQRMLKVVNFSLESIHMTKAQADKIIASLKPEPKSPAPAAKVPATPSKSPAPKR